MIVTNCVTCDRMVYVAETPEEQRLDKRSTKYWSYEDDKSKRPYCYAACGLIDHMNKNNEEIPEWLIADQEETKKK